MTYLVLARKYRPRSFEELVGQEHVVQALSNALTQGRLHHAYLFTGTRGVGKTTVSRILAKSLNCTGTDGQGGITAQPCGVCDACRDIDSGRFVDYVELDAASNRGVEEISQLLDQAVYKPVMGRFKVYMIDEVHMLTTHAFNAMLKTLEEPPDYLKFVLATTDPQKVPPTVLSRCLQFNLRPMAPPTVQEHLAHVLADERIEAEPGALRLLSRAARGSMRDALSLADHAIAFGGGTLLEAGVRQMLGAVDRSHAVRLIESLVAGDGAALVEIADALRALGLSASGTLEELAALLQQMAVAQAVPSAVDANDADTSAVLRLAPALAADETQLFYSMALHGRAELGLAPDEYSGLVMVLLRMLAFRHVGHGVAAGAPAPRTSAALAAAPAAAVAASALRTHSSTAVAAPPAAAPTRAERLPLVAEEPPPWLDEPHGKSLQVEAAVTTPSAPPAQPVAPPAVSAPVPSVLGDRWARAVADMNERGSISAMVRELAMQSQCIEIQDQVAPVRWCLRVDRETLRAAAHCEKLQAALADALGHAVQLEVQAGAAQDSPALRANAERDRRQQEAEQTIHGDPVVRALMAQYKTARIVPGSIKPH
jgi:DNA polymerase III subunit gamma/tau